MREHHLAVRRTARYFTLGHDTERPDELWIVCHGYGQLAARFLARFEPVANARRLIVAPEGLNRYYLDTRPVPHGPDAKVGATWMTREDRLSDISDYVAYLDTLLDAVREGLAAPPSRIVALGFSQGVATVARWLALGRSRVDEVILWAGTIPTDVHPADGARLFHGARLVLVLGTADPATPPLVVDAQRARLDEAGASCEIVRYDGGHEIDAATLRRLAAAAPA